MPSYERELNAAVEAVRCAAVVCRSIEQRLPNYGQIAKADTSPVTVADFASQAVVCAKLQHVLPQIPVVAEEGTQQLRQAANEELRRRVAQHVAAGLGRPAGEAQILEWIDLGHADPNQRRWFWTLDPIDGTKGFLRHQHYAIALALVDEGRIMVAALACPRLSGGDGTGTLVTAVRGRGARMIPLVGATSGPRITVSATSEPACGRFCESLESGHSDQSASAHVAQRLGIHQPPLRMDSQAKYAVVARGDACIYLRLPVHDDYRENIWDHAAGSLIVQEAGGRVTDAEGRELDFTCGRRLENNRGIIATNGKLHDAVLAAVAEGLA